MDDRALTCPVDRKQLAEVTLEDPVFEAEIIADWIAGWPAHQKTLAASVASGEAEQVIFASHSLKGSCRYLGIVEVGRVCHELETLARAGDLQAAPALLKEIDHFVQEACEFMRSEWMLE